MRPLFMTLLAAALVAGCAAAPGEGDDGDGGDVSPPAQMTNAEARDLLASAVEDMPEVFGVNMSVSSGSRELMTITGSFDNASETTYMEIRGDAEALSQLGGEDGGMASAFLAKGFTMYSTPEGSLFLVNGTAYTFPPDDEEEGDGPFEVPDESPMGALLAGDEILRSYGNDSDVVVTSVTPTLYRGRPAIEIVATGAEDNETFTAKIVVFTSPRRIAHIETVLPADENESAANPFNGATMKGDFFYEGEVDLDAPESVVRALALGYTSGSAGFFGGDGSELRWTFLHDGGVALDEVEVHVKEASQDSESMDATAQRTLWSMKLSDGTKTQDGVTITFTDADGDSKVSANDTLVASVADDGIMPPIVLYDTVTGLYVVPSAGVVLALLALAGVAVLVARRR